MIENRKDLRVSHYGSHDGKEIMQYTLTGPTGMIVKLINYGGAVTDLLVPETSGHTANMVLGFAGLEGYTRPENPYFGCITGRFANRIAGGRFTLDGRTYQLPANNGPNTLHGGVNGFNRKYWEAVIPEEKGSLIFRYTSPDGEEGFPGNCVVEVRYTVTADSALRIDYSATTDQPTPVNLTNHSYFNLSSGEDATILGHELTLFADACLEVDADLIPTGKLVPVAGTALDFTRPALVGSDIAKVAGGYDHCYVLNGKPGDEGLRLAAIVRHPASGRKMEVHTTEAGMQFYSGNFLDGTLTGRNGEKYGRHAGFCLEAQAYPDAPNQPAFPNTILRPGETYRQTTIYRFPGH